MQQLLSHAARCLSVTSSAPHHLCEGSRRCWPCRSLHNLFTRPTLFNTGAPSAHCPFLREVSSTRCELHASTNTHTDATALQLLAVWRLRTAQYTSQLHLFICLGSASAHEANHSSYVLGVLGCRASAFDRGGGVLLRPRTTHHSSVSLGVAQPMLCTPHQCQFGRLSSQALQNSQARLCTLQQCLSICASLEPGSAHRI